MKKTDMILLLKEKMEEMKTDSLRKLKIVLESISNLAKIGFRVFMLLVVIYLLVQTKAFNKEILPDPITVQQWSKTYTVVYNQNNIKGYVQPEQVKQLSAIIKENSNLEMDYLNEIEKFMNKNFIYTPDEDIYKLDDMWKSPQRTMLDNMRGDCEDSAIFVDSILNNLINESWIIIGDKHAYNILCIDEKPIIYDITYYLDGENEIYTYLNKHKVYYIFNYRVDDKFNNHFEDISCLNVSQINYST